MSCKILFIFVILAIWEQGHCDVDRGACKALIMEKLVSDEILSHTGCDNLIGALQAESFPFFPGTTKKIPSAEAKAFVSTALECAGCGTFTSADMDIKGKIVAQAINAVLKTTAKDVWGDKAKEDGYGDNYLLVPTDFGDDFESVVVDHCARLITNQAVFDARVSENKKEKGKDKDIRVFEDFAEKLAKKQPPTSNAGASGGSAPGSDKLKKMDCAKNDKKPKRM